MSDTDESSSEGEIRGLALQLATQLPNDPRKALAVLDLTRYLVGCIWPVESGEVIPLCRALRLISHGGQS